VDEFSQKIAIGDIVRIKDDETERRWKVDDIVSYVSPPDENSYDLVRVDEFGAVVEDLDGGMNTSCDFDELELLEKAGSG
jgi:hypothetical protein